MKRDYLSLWVSIFGMASIGRLLSGGGIQVPRHQSTRRGSDEFYYRAYSHVSLYQQFQSCILKYTFSQK